MNICFIQGRVSNIESFGPAAGVVGVRLQFELREADILERWIALTVV
jgi:hypothetical protein